MCSPLSSAKLLVTGKHVILLFSISVPSPSMCISVLYLLFWLLFVDQNWMIKDIENMNVIIVKIKKKTRILL